MEIINFSPVDPTAVVIKLVKQASQVPGNEMQETTRLLEDARLDSLQLMEIVEQVQQELNISFLPEDYTYENFATVGSLAALARERQARR